MLTINQELLIMLIKCHIISYHITDQNLMIVVRVQAVITDQNLMIAVRVQAVITDQNLMIAVRVQAVITDQNLMIVVRVQAVLTFCRKESSDCDPTCPTRACHSQFASPDCKTQKHMSSRKRIS